MCVSNDLLSVSVDDNTPGYVNNLLFFLLFRVFDKFHIHFK